MKGVTLALLYSLLLQLDKLYSEPINVKPGLALDRNIRRKVHEVFMHRWSAFHAPIHSAIFAMDRQFCQRQMDRGIKKDIWSVMEDFSKAPGGKDFSKMKAQYVMFVDVVASKQVCVSVSP
jgi:hypothetical protein